MKLNPEILAAVNELPDDGRRAALRRLHVIARLGVDSKASARRVLLDARSTGAARRGAAWLLALSPDKAAATCLVSLLATSTDRLAIWEAAKALLAIGDARIARRLVELLNTGKTRHGRSAAAWLLGNLRDIRSVPHLRAKVRDVAESADVRAHAAEALGVIATHAAVNDLIAALSDRSPEVRFWAAYALGEIGDKRASPYLRRLARSDRTLVKGWWSVGAEARAALKTIAESAE